jgi:hypothetical protein
MDSETWTGDEAPATFDALLTGDTAPVTDAVDSASASAVCICGQPLRFGGVGRRRLCCSALCKRRRDSLVRQLARRRTWLREWTVVDVDKEIAALVDDIRELTAKLRGERP